MIKNILVTCLSLMMFSVAHAGDQSKKDLAQELLIKSKMLDQMDAFAQNFAYQVSRASSSQDEREIEKTLEKAIEKNYSREQAEKLMVNYIVLNVEENNIERIITWLGSDLGSRLLMEELESAKPIYQKKMRAYLEKRVYEFLGKDRKERLELIKMLVEESRVVEAAVDYSSIVLKGKLFGENFVALKEAKKSEEELNSIYEFTMAYVRAQGELGAVGETVMSFLYIYRDFSDEEILKYIEFHKSDAGKRYLEIGDNFMQVFEKLMLDVFDKLEEETASIDS